MPPTAPRTPLRREAIIDEARSLISRDGLDALTLRHLADQFSVSAPALYAHFHRPDVFGAALCMSPSLWVAKGKIFEHVADQPRPWTTRIYIDAGAHEGQGNMLKQAERMVHHLRGRGWSDHDLRWVADPHGRHHEHDWKRRAPHALEFLFPGTHQHGHGHHGRAA